MAKHHFNFRQFAVQQDRCAMKVGTDGVLLGAWTDASAATSVLDIGTGTGLLALMLAQKSEARITAIDIDAQAAQQAAENFANSKWNNRLQALHCSLSAFVRQTPVAAFDLIVSNPPFFINSLKPQAQQRAHARHTDTLSHEELLAAVSQLLLPRGTFCVILPTDNRAAFVAEALSCKLFVHQIVTIYPTPAKLPKRVLLKFGTQPQAATESQLIVETDLSRIYTHDFVALTQDYYLDSAFAKQNAHHTAQP